MRKKSKKKPNIMKLRLLILAALAFGKITAQEMLTVEQAVKTALENNYDITIARNDLKIDQQNVLPANAGMLPQVNASVSQSNGIQDLAQVRTDGTRNALDNAKSKNLNYGVNLGWTIFDGFRMFARYDQLKAIAAQGDAELKTSIISKIADVMSTYYDIVQQQQQLVALDSTLTLSRQRVQLAQNRYTIGKAAKLEVLNAQVDLNTDQTNLLRQKETLAHAKIGLNELMARDPKTEFTVVDDIAIDSTLLLPDLSARAEKQNPLILQQLIGKRIAELNLKQVRANRYPTVGVNTGYNFSESHSSLGFTSESYAHGLTYGFSASLNVFNGFLQKRNERIAKLQIENAQAQIAQQTLAINSQLNSAYQTYLTNLQLVDVEKNNEELARQNLQITLDKYHIGTITQIEIRTAQVNYINAQFRHSEALNQAKLSEITLLELAGDLKI